MDSFSTSPLFEEEFLKEAYFKGMLVGPDEDFKKFLSRSKSQESISFYSSDQEILGFSPKVIPLLFKRKGLMPWQAAAVFTGSSQDIFSIIFSKEPSQGSEEVISLIQMQPVLEKGRYLFYRKEEIIAHEMVHFFRSGFQEPRFEEVFAYRTSSSRFRRYFGPIFSSTTESAIFLGLLLTTFLSLFFWIPIGLLIFLGLGRLVKRQKTFHRTLRSLEAIFGKKSSSFILSLTDREIEEFSIASKQEILKRINRESSLRWVQLRSVYKDFL